MTTERSTTTRSTSGTSSRGTRKSTQARTAQKNGQDDGRSNGQNGQSNGQKNGHQSAERKAPKAARSRRKSGTMIAADAAKQLLEVTGRDVEGITAVERTEDGWRVQVEVLEVRRIPDTTDVLALYDLEVGPDGELDGYRRVERYVRGTPGEGAWS